MGLSYITAAEKCRAQVQQLIQNLGNDGFFLDHTFPVDQPAEILYFEGNSPTKAGFSDKIEAIGGWKRLRDIVSSGNPVLFKDDVTVTDVKQGSLGDCWLVSSLSVLSQKPEILKRCLVTFDEEIGIYGFVFYKHGRWVPIIIDDWFPVKKKAKKAPKLIFSRSTDPDETWVSLFEKAMAKLHGAYEGIVSGGTACGMVDLTGGLTRKYNPSECTKAQLKALLAQARQNGEQFFLGCSIHGKEKPTNGLITGHSYGVVDFYEGKPEYLVKIRNPWGAGKEWNGRWGDNCEEWKKYPLTKKATGACAAKDGMFWMSWEDFITSWTTIFVTQIFPDTYKQALLYDIYDSNSEKKYLLQLPTKMHVGIGVDQRDKSYAQEGKKYFPLGFTVTKKCNSNWTREVPVKSIRSTAWWSQKPLSKGDYIITISFAAKKATPYYIRVFTPKTAHLQQQLP